MCYDMFFLLYDKVDYGSLKRKFNFFKQINLFIDMLYLSDFGCCKNVCFVLSCIVFLVQGYQRLREYERINGVIEVFCFFFVFKDEESIWFLLM